MTEANGPPEHTLEEMLEPVARAAGVGGAASALARYLRLLTEWNARVNLVSRRSTLADLVGHVADSLGALPFLPSRRALRLLDIGSGGGFPAIPILLARPEASGVLVEATGKKAAFLVEAIRSLGLTATVANVRFPDSLSQMPPFDVLTSRAVADPVALAAAGRRFLARDGRALLWTTRGVLGAGSPVRFHPLAGSEQKGIAVVECST